ncbi:unnamed protein product, partial [Candidula unifasciata]
MYVLVSLAWTLSAALLHREVSGSNYQDRRDYRYDNIVHTSHGSVQGQTENIPVKDGGHVKVDVFQGIPFARPPVGDLRFRRPLPADPWSGTLQATTPPNTCVQVLRNDTAPFPRPLTPVSEDCLYLNIWRPRCPGTGGKLATMVWHHGELFTFDSSVTDLYNGSFLAASQCVIVASMNYRLGAFGFLYLGIPESPGNMGLLDITLALTWIKDNMRNFGGDPNKITVFGQAFGADIVSLMLLSPLTRNLFNNAIVQGGSPKLRFVHRSTQASLTAALELARRLNCPTDNQTAAAQCLRQVDAADLALQHLIMTSTFVYLTVATTDGYFLTKDPQVSLDTGDLKPCDIITGNNKDAGTYGLALALPATYNFRRSPPLLNDQDLDSSLTVILGTLFKPEFIARLIVELKMFYKYSMLRQEAGNPSLALLNLVTNDAFFYCPNRRLVAAYANTSQNVYLYAFNHARDITTLDPWVGAHIVVEVPFVLGTTSPDYPDFSPRETKLKQSVMKLWANFAKSG